MDEVNFIVREPLLDPKGQLLGYELTQQKNENSPVADVNALIAFLAAQIRKADAGWQLGEALVFLKAEPASLALSAVDGLPPKNIVFSLNSFDAADAATVDTVKALRAQGFGISLGVPLLVKLDKTLLPLFTHGEMPFGVTDLATHAKINASLMQISIRMVARQVDNWQDYDATVKLGIDSMIGTLYLEPRASSAGKGLNPAQAMILQLMQLVKANADVKELESVLRRDAAVSYKLLRYINSVGFGLGAEIQSLRHAVTMLGYSPLYRWLSLLLATASTAGYAPALMQAAVVRGRLAELLGHGFLPKNEAENLFVTGMFSLLDRLLGVPMEEVLENIQLSESVTRALLGREGMYGPFLALAEACELNNGNVGELADALFIDGNRVNEAHLAALAWTQTLKL